MFQVRRILLLVAAAAVSLVPHGVSSQQAPQSLSLISVGIDGLGGDNLSGNVFSQAISPRTRISADGRFVVFESAASNLVCGQTNPWADVFVRDRLLGSTTLVSMSSAGVPGNLPSYDPVISADGHYVAFVSEATNLVAEDTNGFNDVFLRDLQAGTTIRLNVSSAGTQADSVSHAPAISADGRFVAFESAATNLVAGDPDTTLDVFVRDVQAGTTEIVSVTSDGGHGTCCDAMFPSISDDGRLVAFLSQDRLDTRFGTHWQEVFVRDRQASTTTLVSLTAEGGTSNTGVRFAAISGDGHQLAWQSNSSNVVPGRTGPSWRQCRSALPSASRAASASRCESTPVPIVTSRLGT